MRVDFSNHGNILVDEEFYCIEEFQSKWNRWVSLSDSVYLSEYMFGENSASGRCWQETGTHGMYSFEYAKRYCNALNDALKSGRIAPDVAQVTEFRLVKWKRHFEKTIIVTDEHY